MPHEFESGWLYREPAWHGLGNVTMSRPTSWEEARKWAGLEWEIEMRPVAIGAAQLLPGDVRFVDWQETAEYYGLCRNDTRKLLSVRPASWAAIANGEYGALIEYVLGLEAGNVRFETLGSLYGGRMLFCLVRYETAWVVPGDPSPHYTYVVFLLRHDGQGGLTVIPTNIRVLCANTARAAEALGGQLAYTIRHTRNWAERLGEVKTALAGAHRDREVWQEIGARLVDTPLTETGEEAFLRQFLPISDDMSELAARNQQDRRTAVEAILRSETCAGVRGSVYAPVMAATEWAEHERPARTPDTRIARSLTRADPYRTKALRVGMKIARIRPADFRIPALDLN